MDIQFEIQDLAFSMVILSEQNNPSILTPDFLKETNIVNKDWLLDDNIFCTPQFANIGYKNGVRFSLDCQSLSVVDIAPNGDEFPVPDIATKFIEAVPLVKYHSLGINFDGLVAFNDPKHGKRFMIEKFLNKDILGTGFNIISFTPNLSIQWEDTVCNLSFQNMNEGKLKDTTVYGIAFKANFHREFKKINDNKLRNSTIIEKINGWSVDKKRYLSIVKNLISG